MKLILSTWMIQLLSTMKWLENHLLQVFPFYWCKNLLVIFNFLHHVGVQYARFINFSDEHHDVLFPFQRKLAWLVLMRDSSANVACFWWTPCSFSSIFKEAKKTCLACFNTVVQCKRCLFISFLTARHIVSAIECDRRGMVTRIVIKADKAIF